MKSVWALLITAACYLGSCPCYVSCQADLTQTPEQMAGESVLSLTKAQAQNIQVLHVLECEGPQDWQLVPATENVVSWMRDLSDRLTISKARPAGEDLTIPSWWVHKGAQPAIQTLKGTQYMDENGQISFYNMLQAQLIADAEAVWLPKYLLVLYQLTMVEGGPAVKDLHVTASKSFWQTVEATAASGAFVYKSGLDAAEQPLPSIEGYAVILPTLLSVLYGQGEWPEESVSVRYGDHSAWDRPEMLEMLEYFFSITQAISLPDLAEYEWRSDKVAQFKLFQQYHDSNPEKHTPPIPSVPVHPAASWRLLRHICYQQRHVTDTYTASEEDIRATAAALLEAAKQLDSNPHAQSIWAHDTRIQGSSVRKYIIKRNHAGFARRVIKMTLGLDNWQSTPSLTSLLQRKRTSAQYKGGCHPNGSCSYGSEAPSQVASHIGNAYPGLVQTPDAARLSSFKVAAVCASLAQHGWKLAQGILSSTPFTSHNTSTSQSYHNLEQSSTLQTPAVIEENNLSEVPQAEGLTSRNSSKQTVSIQQPTDILQDAQQLLKAAKRVLLESCGEDWLLQPFIPDMGTGEYRVNLIGGGEAIGTATDTAVVFTPGEAAHNQMYLYNMTLPHGFFSQAPPGTSTHLGSVEMPVIAQPSDTAKEEYAAVYFPFSIYKDPSMHKMLTDIALGGAQAFQQFKRPNRMSQHVLLRIDIACTRFGDQVRPFINEAHYYADATIMFPVWPPESNTTYTCQPHVSTDASEQPYNTTEANVKAEDLDKAVHCPEGISKHPQQAITGWGIWMAEGLWKEIQWQHTEAGPAALTNEVLV